ncbi:hypothetical protein MBLNU459_g4896t1 [Dothideomycetes sp. NU459]
MEYENEARGYDDEPQYPRERSRSPRPDRDGDSRIRSASPAGARGDDRYVNLVIFSEMFTFTDVPTVRRLFEKYGDVETCSIMRDPHTRESRGFGFVKMVTGEQADAAKSGLQGEVYEGRTLSIEKARRARPRTPTPGKYFGPPKRDDRRGGGRFEGRGFGGRRDDGGGYGRPRYGGGDRYGGGGGGRDYGDRDRYDDRRGGYGGRRDDYDRGSYSRRDRDEYAPRGYGSSREDRYASAPRESSSRTYADGAAPPADAAPRGGYGDEDRYARR